MKRKKGICKAGGEKNKVLDERGLCSICAFKIDSADKEAEDVVEIRREMREMGVPLKRRRRDSWDE